MKEALLHTLASQTPFSYAEVSAFYDQYKSFDLLIAVCEFCATMGIQNLHSAVTMFILGRKNDDEGVYRLENIDAFHVRLTRVSL